MVNWRTLGTPVRKERGAVASLLLSLKAPLSSLVDLSQQTFDNPINGDGRGELQGALLLGNWVAVDEVLNR